MAELKVAVSDSVYFRDPLVDPPPKGKKIGLLTKGGIYTVGLWDDDCIGWLEVPKIPYSIKQRMKNAKSD